MWCKDKKDNVKLLLNSFHLQWCWFDSFDCWRSCWKFLTSASVQNSVFLYSNAQEVASVYIKNFCFLLHACSRWWCCFTLYFLITENPVSVSLLHLFCLCRYVLGTAMRVLIFVWSSFCALILLNKDTEVFYFVFLQ